MPRRHQDQRAHLAVLVYRRHGFEIVADYKPAPDGPQTYGMWREPNWAATTRPD
jgi:hypothetical protein